MVTRTATAGCTRPVERDTLDVPQVCCPACVGGGHTAACDDRTRAAAIREHEEALHERAMNPVGKP